MSWAELVEKGREVHQYVLSETTSTLHPRTVLHFSTIFVLKNKNYKFMVEKFKYVLVPFTEFQILYCINFLQCELCR